MFKEHHGSSVGMKKGNVETDIVFEMMRNLLENKDFQKIILVSGDGDYKKVIDYLIAKRKFAKTLFPNKQFASSLYKKLGTEFFDYLNNLKSYIEYRRARKNEKGS